MKGDGSARETPGVVEVILVETPISAYMREEDLKLVVKRDPSIIGEDVEIVLEEYNTGGGSVDLLGKGGDTVYLIELKRVTSPKVRQMVLNQALEQLANYREGIKSQMEVFNARVKVALVAVLGVVDKRKTTRSIVTLEGRFIRPRETVRKTPIIDVDAEIERAKARLLKRMADEEEEKLVLRKGELREEIEKLKEMKAREEDKLFRLREKKVSKELSIKQLKALKYGQRLLYQLPYQYKREANPDICLLCKRGSHVEINTGDFVYGLCQRCWNATIDLENLVLYGTTDVEGSA